MTDSIVPGAPAWCRRFAANAGARAESPALTCSRAAGGASSGVAARTSFTGVPKGARSETSDASATNAANESEATIRTRFRRPPSILVSVRQKCNEGQFAAVITYARREALATEGFSAEERETLRAFALRVRTNLDRLRDARDQRK